MERESFTIAMVQYTKVFGETAISTDMEFFSILMAKRRMKVNGLMINLTGMGWCIMKYNLNRIQLFLFKTNIDRAKIMQNYSNKNSLFSMEKTLMN